MPGVLLELNKYLFLCLLSICIRVKLRILFHEEWVTASFTLLSLECFLETLVGSIRGLTFLLYNARSGAICSLALYTHTSKINSLIWYTGDYKGEFIYFSRRQEKIEIFILLLHCGNLYKFHLDFVNTFELACMHVNLVVLIL